MIKILNPVPKGAAMVQYSRAERYVKAGRAEWSNPAAITFKTNDYRYQAALQTALEGTRGYDARGPMTLKEIANIPVINPGKLRR
jgi:hypothetical protein